MDNQLALVDGASRYQKDRSDKADDTVFVHCCCGKGNLLPKPVEGQGLKVLDNKRARLHIVESGERRNPKYQRSWRCFLSLFTVHRWFDVAAFDPRTGQQERLE